MNQLTINPANFIKSAQDLKQSLTEIAPDNSQMTKLITFALTATAIVGMFIYHYVKSQEDN